VGADSNGSGVSALLEAARVLSRLFRAKHTQPAANLLFLLAGGGPLNYQGSKRFLEDQLDNSEDSLLSSAPSKLVLCLDGLASSPVLRLHVSKPPKEGTLMAAFWERLQSAGRLYGVEVELVHRKINLKDSVHPWEHHRYSLRRLPAATLSARSGPAQRASLSDDAVDEDLLTRHVAVLNAALIATLLGQQVTPLPASLSVAADSVAAWQRMLTAQPRSPQLLLPAGKHPLTALLSDTLQRYTEDVHTSVHRPDKLEPEFGFHSATGGVLTAYATKPATFDLLLSCAVAAYLSVLWVALQQLPRLKLLLHTLLPASTVVVANGKLKHKMR